MSDDASNEIILQCFAIITFIYGIYMYIKVHFIKNAINKWIY